MSRLFSKLTIGPGNDGPISLESDSAQVFDLARTWLNLCLENHDRCRQSSANQESPHLLPLRLLDVGSIEDLEPEAHLVNTTGRSFDDMPYLALSHCWGKESHAAAMTTTGNLKARGILLPVSNLPKTILDAIIVTRQLGFRYLWIDTLCVMQDSIEDWETACATMAGIYANSACTIAASASKDDESGFLLPRDPHAIGWIGIDFPSPTPSDYNLVYNRIVCNYQWPVPITSVARKVMLLPNVPDPRASVKSGPLSQRGWTLQERCLSPRMLHFTEKQLTWECESTWSYESFHFTAPSIRRY